MSGPESPDALLRERINEVADALDGGVFAPDAVQRLDLELVGRLFAELASDRSLSLAHSPAGDDSDASDPRCPVDRERVPCTRLQSLMTRYDVAAPEPTVDGEFLAGRGRRTSTDEEVIQIITRIVAEISKLG